MRFKRLLLVFILILSLLLSFAQPARAADTKKIIRQILIYYSHHQAQAETDILQLLTQLEQEDPEACRDWQQILETWRWAAEDLEVTYDVLPDGLPQDDSLCIIVMGFQLTHGGSMYDELIHRLEVALASAQKYPNAYILCAGGGTARDNPNVTEAGQMARWLKDHGVAPERIIVENRSYSTEDNALFSQQILYHDYPQVNSLALISSDYHLRRCYLLFTAGILLQNPDYPYTIVGDACFDAGYEGTNEGYLEEAKSLGNMLKMYVDRTGRPELTKLTGITVSGETEYQVGDPLSLTVTAEYETGFTRDVTHLATVSGFESSLYGEQEVLVQYTENDVSVRSSIVIHVAPPPSTAPATEPTVPTVPESQPAGTTAMEVVPDPVPDSHISFPFVFLACSGLGCLILWASHRRRRGKYEKRRRK